MTSRLTSFIFALVICCTLLPPSTAQENGDIEKWNGYKKVNFQVAERSAYLVVPENPAHESPWVWRARFPNFHPEVDLLLLEKGFHIAYIDVAGLFGGPKAMEIGDAFYEHLTTERNLSKTPVLEGVSRGGLFVYNWAARNSSKVACIYCDTPVCDFKSWPAGLGDGIGHAPSWKNCKAAYGLTNEGAMEFQENPIDHSKKIAAANIPLMHIVSESDQVVPPSENTYILRERLAALGHPMQIISVKEGTKESNGHHFTHPDPKRVAEFIVKHTQLVAERRRLLASSPKILFLGDSITYSGEYVSFFDTWLQTLNLENTPTIINVGLPSETVSGLSEDGHAGGRFPRPDLDERLDRVLASVNPDLVFACYGINCGIYQPFDQDRFAAYQAGIENLRKKVKAAGSELVLITPPSFDDLRSRKDFSYNEVMGQYSNWLMELRNSGQDVIDLHSAMTHELNERRKAEPEFTFQPDSVHPNQAGHWFMASQLINWFGDVQAAHAKSPSQLVAQTSLTDEIVDNVRRRMTLLRDAYLTETRHVRPGIKAGLPIEKALEQAKQLTEEINRELNATKTDD